MDRTILLSSGVDRGSIPLSRMSHSKGWSITKDGTYFKKADNGIIVLEDNLEVFYPNYELGLDCSLVSGELLGSHSSNILSLVQSPISHCQTHFHNNFGCTSPINLSTTSNAVLHSPHIEVAGKYYESVGDWYLTGTLDSHARCGEFVRALGCEHFGIDDKKHDRIIETYSCHRPGCPVCYESWAFREAKTADERLREGKQLYHEAGKNFSLKHGVISPSPSEYPWIRSAIISGNYPFVKKKVLSLAVSAGMIGGCISPHFWRQVGEKEELPENVIIPDGLKEGDWYFSPHWHFIYAGFLIPSDKFFLAHNKAWRYINLGKRKSVKETIFYFLTHCANHEKHHAVSWFGIYSYNKLVIDFIELKEVNVPCSACGSALHDYASDYSWDNLDTLEPDWTHDLGIHSRKVKIRHFKLRESDSVGYHIVVNALIEAFTGETKI